MLPAMLSLLSLLAYLAEAGPNPIFEQLTVEGLDVDGQATQRIKLPPPAMADGLDAAAQRAVIEKVSGGRRYEDMVRDSIVAPFAMKIEDLPATDGDPLRRVDVWYIVHGELDRFFDEGLASSLAELARSENKDNDRGRGPLKEADLAARGLKTFREAARKEYFAYNSGSLFDKVQVSATRHLIATRGDGSITVAGVIDRRFNDDAKFPNRWQPIEIDGGTRTLGEPRPYVASGSYTKVTRLREPAGALFVEHHHLFAEPHGWFRGAPLLRSKLPLVIQDSVRKLRRELRASP